MLVGMLIRRAQDAGGFAMVLRKGDATSGVILMQLLQKGTEFGLFERMSDGRDGFALRPCGPQYWGKADEMAQYIDRRAKSDPDMWLLELDIPDAQRLVDEFRD